MTHRQLSNGSVQHMVCDVIVYGLIVCVASLLLPGASPLVVCCWALLSSCARPRLLRIPHCTHSTAQHTVAAYAHTQWHMWLMPPSSPWHMLFPKTACPCIGRNLGQVG